MGTKRVGLARTQALIENLKRSIDLTSTTLANLANITGIVRQACALNAVQTAGSSATAIDDGFICRIDSANNAHKAKMFVAEYAGQWVIVANVDSSQDFILRNNADSGNLATIGEGKAVIMVATDTGDNWQVILST